MKRLVVRRCMNNLKQLETAAANYAETNGCYPMGVSNVSKMITNPSFPERALLQRRSVLATASVLRAVRPLQRT